MFTRVKQFFVSSKFEYVLRILTTVNQRTRTTRLIFLAVVWGGEYSRSIPAVTIEIYIFVKAEKT